MIIVIYILFFVLVSIMFYAMFIEADPYSWTAGIKVAFLFLTLAILQIVGEVNQFLLSLLSIQRFFLYFFSGFSMKIGILMIFFGFLVSKIEFFAVKIVKIAGWRVLGSFVEKR